MVVAFGAFFVDGIRVGFAGTLGAGHLAGLQFVLYLFFESE
jgi:hypothetical protein